MAEIADIQAFIARATGVRESNLQPESDLELDLRMAGDDFSETIEAFAREFNVNMSEYRWYFHHADEGFLGIGALLFKPPYRRVPRVAVTPRLLLAAAQAGHWPASYPEHSLPERRYDLLFNYALLVFTLLAIAGFLVFAPSDA